MAVSINPTFARPAEDEYASFYAGYVGRAGEGGLVEQMEAQVEEVSHLLRGLHEEAALARYELGKWSVKEVAGHLADTERVMTYRALRIARGDQTPLPGFDENAFVANADFDARPLASLVGEWEAVRRSTLALFRGLAPDTHGRTGTASGQPVTVRALAYITAGHVAHHLEILRTRYGLR
ncbi:MAG TPA: DinB family protein [Longimicrobium sp.]